MLALGAASGCVRGPRSTVVRRVDGAERPGRFVSPYEYEHFVRAERCAALADFACAVAGYENALLGAEEDPYVLARLAEALDGLGDAEGSSRRLGRAEALGPRSVDVALARARIAERHERWDEAVAAGRRALALGPDSPETKAWLARLLLRLDRADEAAAVLGTGPHDSLVLAEVALDVACARRDRTAILAAAHALAMGWAFGDDRLRSLATRSAGAGDPGLAADLLAMLRVPGESDRRLGLAYLAAARRTDDLDVALARAATGPLVVDAGFAELATSQPERALERADSVLATEPDPRARRLRGEALLALGRSDEGMRELRAVPFGTLEARPARLALASALRSAGREHEAAEVLAELDRRDPP